MKPESLERKKVLFFCVDGASWKVINPLLKSNSLPNIKKLLLKGAWGVLESCDPLISAVLWTSIVSGKSPDLHGIHSFSTNSASVKCKRLWDIFKEDGFKVGLYNFLLTWPPCPINGFIIPGFLACGEETYPEELSFIKKLWINEKVNRKTTIYKYLKYAVKCIAHGVRLHTLIESGWNILKGKIVKIDYLYFFYKKRMLGLKLNTDIFIHLFKKVKPDFTCFYTNVIDACSHSYWKFAFPHDFTNVKQADIKKFGEVINKAYKEVDKSLGKIISYVDEDTTIVFLSDHGFRPIVSAATRLLSLIRTNSLLNKLGMKDHFEGINIGLRVYIRKKDSGKFSNEKICSLLNNIRLKKTGGKIFTIYSDVYDNVICEFNDENIRKVQNDISSQEIIFPDSTNFLFKDIIEDSNIRSSGTHDKNGVLIMSGKDIKENFRFEKASIYDVAPTVLSLMKKPAAEDMNGKPLVSVLKDEFIKNNPIVYTKTYEERKNRREPEDPKRDEDIIKRRLEALGYIQ